MMILINVVAIFIGCVAGIGSWFLSGMPHNKDIFIMGGVIVYSITFTLLRLEDAIDNLISMMPLPKKEKKL